MPIEWKKVSIGLNIILIIIIFFKSGLNQILLEWWKEKRERKKIQRSSLNQIRIGLYDLRVAFSNACVSYLLFQSNIGSPPKTNYLKETFDKYLKQWNEDNEKIISLTPDIPKALKEKTENLLKRLGSIVMTIEKEHKNIVSGKYPGEILEKMTNLDIEVQNLIKEIDKLL